MVSYYYAGYSSSRQICSVLNCPLYTIQSTSGPRHSSNPRSPPPPLWFPCTAVPSSFQSEHETTTPLSCPARYPPRAKPQTSPTQQRNAPQKGKSKAPAAATGWARRQNGVKTGNLCLHIPPFDSLLFIVEDSNIISDSPPTTNNSISDTSTSPDLLLDPITPPESLAQPPTTAPRPRPFFPRPQSTSTKSITSPPFKMLNQLSFLILSALALMSVQRVEGQNSIYTTTLPVRPYISHLHIPMPSPNCGTTLSSQTTCTD